MFKLCSSPSIHQNLKCRIRIFRSFLQVKNTWRNSIQTGSKERFFVQNRKILSIKIYTLSTKANTKGCFGYNTRSFCSGFFILTIYFPKNGYICENIKPLYIHFFGKTNSFRKKTFSGRNSRSVTGLGWFDGSRQRQLSSVRPFIPI